MDNDFCNNYGYLEIFGGIYLWKFPLLTKCVRGRIETFSMSGQVLAAAAWGLWLVAWLSGGVGLLPWVGLFIWLCCLGIISHHQSVLMVSHPVF